MGRAESWKRMPSENSFILKFGNRPAYGGWGGAAWAVWDWIEDHLPKDESAGADIALALAYERIAELERQLAEKNDRWPGGTPK